MLLSDPRLACPVNAECCVIDLWAARVVYPGEFALLPCRVTITSPLVEFGAFPSLQLNVTYRSHPSSPLATTLFVVTQSFSVFATGVHVTADTRHYAPSSLALPPLHQHQLPCSTPLTTHVMPITLTFTVPPGLSFGPEFALELATPSPFVMTATPPQGQYTNVTNYWSAAFTVNSGLIRPLASVLSCPRTPWVGNTPCVVDVTVFVSIPCSVVPSPPPTLQFVYLAPVRTVVATVAVDVVAAGLLPTSVVLLSTGGGTLAYTFDVTLGYVSMATAAVTTSSGSTARRLNRDATANRMDAGPLPESRGLLSTACTVSVVGGTSTGTSSVVGDLDVVAQSFTLSWSYGDTVRATAVYMTPSGQQGVVNQLNLNACGSTQVSSVTCATMMLHGLGPRCDHDEDANCVAWYVVSCHTQATISLQDFVDIGWHLRVVVNVSSTQSPAALSLPTVTSTVLVAAAAAPFHAATSVSTSFSPLFNTTAAPGLSVQPSMPYCVFGVPCTVTAVVNISQALVSMGLYSPQRLCIGIRAAHGSWTVQSLPPSSVWYVVGGGAAVSDDDNDGNNVTVPLSTSPTFGYRQSVCTQLAGGAPQGVTAAFNVQLYDRDGMAWPLVPSIELYQEQQVSSGGATVALLAVHAVVVSRPSDVGVVVPELVATSVTPHGWRFTFAVYATMSVANLTLALTSTASTLQQTLARQLCDVVNAVVPARSTLWMTCFLGITAPADGILSSLQVSSQCTLYPTLTPTSSFWLPFNPSLPSVAMSLSSLQGAEVVPLNEITAPLPIECGVPTSLRVQLTLQPGPASPLTGMSLMFSGSDTTSAVYNFQTLNTTFVGYGYVLSCVSGSVTALANPSCRREIQVRRRSTDGP